MSVYSEKFKSRMVTKMVGSNRMSANALSKESGISQGTLSRWLRHASVAGVSDETKPRKRPRGPAAKWPLKDKMRVVLEADGLDDAALGAFLRQAGIHMTDLEAWRQMGTSSEPVTSRAATNKDKKRIRTLEKELRRKDKALAEAAALLVLQKKVRQIWGDADDGTEPENDE
jgi:transposase